MRHFFLAFLAVIATTSPARAEPTEIVVRVISEDAKFIGDSMGGVEVVLRDAKTGRALAKGKTSGGTGNTARIMQANGRSPLIATPDAAAFSAQIDIDEPRLVNLEASGPVNRPASKIWVTSQRWIMPGQPVTAGDGWVVELPGLAITSSARVVQRDSSSDTQAVSVSAKVELLCGCPITPAGLWDAKDYQVTVSIWQPGRRIDEAPLVFVESPGGFAGELRVARKGRFRMYVHARNLVTGNSGITELLWPER